MTHERDDGVRRPFRVLFVCTANLCRSPMAEHLLRQRIESLDLDWHISSAGTQARDGLPMSPRAQAALVDHGIRPAATWVSRHLNAPMLVWADLILTATEWHRSVVIKAVPTALSRTFYLNQFAHLAGGVVASNGIPARGGELITMAHAARGGLQPLPKAQRDLVDPIGRGQWAFAECANNIIRAIDRIVPYVR